MNKKQFYLAFAFCIIILISFACKTFIEPDIWWQITTGEWILIHHQVPKTDMLSYTYAGEPWVNIKWLAEVFMYSIAKYTSPDFIYLILGLFYIPILYIGYKIYCSFLKANHPLFSFSFIIALLVFMITISHRVNGRPEVFSYFFSALYLFIFIKSSQNKKLLFALIPLQLIWCNTHEAYGVGIVMILIFTCIELIWNTPKNRILHLLVLIISILIISINPIGTKIFSYTINIFSQLDKNKFTSELLDYSSSAYWDLFSILNLATFVIGSFTLIRIGKQVNWKTKELHSKIPLYYIILYVAFFYLSLKSNRNIPFFQIVALPIYALALSSIKATFIHQSKAFIYTISVFTYLSIVSNLFYKTFDKHNEFGLGISPKYNPIGVTNYLSKEPNKGKVFSDFLCANYPLYHLRPDFKSYIDLRDLDVFPAKFFENCLYLYQAPNTMVSPTQTLWQMADSLDHFNYVMLVNQPDFIPLHQELHRGNLFNIIYADANSSLYKRNALNENKLSIDSFFHEYNYYKPYILSTVMNHLLNPFFKNIEQKESSFEEDKTYYQNEFM